ncbi:class I SAM-dependent methyltransferase [Clostridium folliculivorans]|uniref:Methyltransferase n=1 Tax=Clostridium folliculivorans TaxID=2886038 RepID=A0A9W5Y1L6_9CLOT|nr:class I SAM-dependent methyltransferase [Clostridium folliculivorans]GKU24875.1 methyltransferase [Clostridium folliculivorans]GKU30973.1 methyltransferase [Clostridium folliculivorans]
MSEIARRLNQCRRPTGDVGKIVVENMNESHYNLTTWGLEKIDVNKNCFILDIGCGGGKTVNRLAEKAESGKVYGMDYSDDCVKWSIDLNKKLIDENKVEIFQGTAESIPFKNEKFDLITAVETIYFWPNIKGCFEEIKRILKIEGTFVIINEMYRSDKFKERNEKFEEVGNMNIFSSDELELLLKDVGFGKIEIDLIEDKNWLRCMCKKNK